MREIQRKAVASKASGKAMLAGALALALSVGMGAGQAMGASGTWSTTPTDSDWSTASNWSTSPAAAPGNNDGGTSTTADVATFGSSSNTTVNIDAGRAIGNLQFTSTSAAYTFSGSNTLYVRDAGGYVIDASAAPGAAMLDFDAPLNFDAGLDYGVHFGSGQAINFNNTVFGPGGKNMLFGSGNDGTVNFNAGFGTTATDGTAGMRFVGSSPGTVNFYASNIIGGSARTVGILTDQGSPGVYNLYADSITNGGSVTIGSAGTVTVHGDNAINGASVVAIGNNYTFGNTAFAQFNNQNSYAGDTTIGNTSFGMAASNAVLQIANGTSGSATGSGNVSIVLGTLEGAGQIINTGAGKGVTLGVGSVLAPGDTGADRTGAIGTMTLSLGNNGLDLSALANTNVGSLVFDLSNGGSDLVNLTDGTLNVGNNLNPSDFTFRGGTLDPGTYTLFQTTNAITGYQTIDTISTVQIGTNFFHLALTNSNQNLVLTAVPEPGTLGLLAVGGLALVGRRRRMA